MKILRFHVTIFVLLLVPLPYQNVECKFQLLTEWSRRFFDFVRATPLARKFLSGGEPVTTTALITAQGYPAETHHVTTEDGYILEMHRIPHGHPNNIIRPQPPTQKSRIPVLIFHGNAQSSADWVVNTPVHDALGFFLADAGYDVWLANQRGNTYSTRHVTLTTADSKFWEFSVHEIGYYDIAAMVDYILLTTGQPRVHYIGFSLSGGSFMVFLSKRPEYNDKIGIGVLMAPGGIYYEGFLFGIAKIAGPVGPVYELFDDVLGGIPIIPHFVANLMHRVLPIVCHRKVDLLGVCVNVLRVIFGHDFGLIGKSKMPLITSVAPTPFSVRTVIHGIQQAGFGQFTEYDFGIRKNKMIYGNPRPPAYNLTNVRAPISIMVGPGDYHATPKDAKRLARMLPNVVDFYPVKYAFWRHLDFCYAKGVGRMAYGKVLEYLDAFTWPT